MCRKQEVPDSIYDLVRSKVILTKTSCSVISIPLVVIGRNCLRLPKCRLRSAESNIFDGSAFASLRNKLRNQIESILNNFFSSSWSRTRASQLEPLTLKME